MAVDVLHYAAVRDLYLVSRYVSATPQRMHFQDSKLRSRDTESQNYASRPTKPGSYVKWYISASYMAFSIRSAK